MTERGYSVPSRKLIKQINEEFRLKQGRSLPPLPFSLVSSLSLSRLAAPVFVLVYTLSTLYADYKTQTCTHSHTSGSYLCSHR